MFTLSKKKVLDGVVTVNVDTVKLSSWTLVNQHPTSVFFYKSVGRRTHLLGSTSIGGGDDLKSETCSAVFKDLIFVGDFDGKVHTFEVSSGDDVTDGPYKRRSVEKLHRSKVAALSVIDVDDVMLLATASADGFVRLWRVVDAENFRLVGEFSGRGIPFVSMASVVNKNRFKKYEVNLLVADLKGVYVLSLHVL